MHPWHWHWHPAAWLSVGALAVAYVSAVVDSRYTADRPSRRQMVSFGAGCVVLLVALAWPLGDLAATWSVLAHLASHVLLLFVAPPLLILGLSDGFRARLTASPSVDRALVAATNPLAATLIFNGAVIGAHIPAVMNAEVRSRGAHMLVHLVVFGAAVLMWTAALGALPGARRMGPLGRIGFLALQSLVPNVPAAVLLFSDGPFYTAYGDRSRALGMAPLLDQQLGGALVKFACISVLGTAAAIVFFGWFARDRSDRDGRDIEPLRWIDVERELERTERRERAERARVAPRTRTGGTRERVPPFDAASFGDYGDSD